MSAANEGNPPASSSAVCRGCRDRDATIAALRGQVMFHKSEQDAWRKLFEEQRGSEVFNTMQRELVELRCQQMKPNTSLSGAETAPKETA